MTNAFPITLLFAGLALSGAVNASASQLDVRTDGVSNTIRASGYGRHASADLVISGDDNRVDFFAGPCARDGQSRTVLRGAHQSRIVIAPCP